MASVAARRLREQLRAERERRPKPLAQARSEWIAEAENEAIPADTRIASVDMAGVAAEWISQAGSDDRGAILLLHGGGYNSGNCITHRNLAARLALASGLKVLVPDYRLAPENPFPAGLQDVLAVYGAMLKSGIAPSEIVVAGDSAGGGLAVALMLSLRDAGAPLPVAAVLLSPWTDVQCRGQSYETRRDADPSMLREGLLVAAADYCGNISPDHHLISPVNADLSDLPTMLIQVGGLEIMLDDSVVFAARAQDAGTQADLEIWPDMWHVFQSLAAEVPEAQDALDKIGQFIRDQLAATAAQT